MSVDISVGFRFKEIYSLEEALIWMKNQRPHILSEAKRQFQKYLLDQVMTQKLALIMAESDLPHLSKFKERASGSQYPSSLSIAFKDIMSKLGEDVYDDLKTKSSIVALPAGRRKTILFGLFTSNSFIRTLFQNHPDIENYNYSNAVNSAPNVTAKEWKKRGKDWEKVLKPANSRRWGSFAENGVEIQVLDEIEIRLFDFKGMPEHLDEEWYDLDKIVENLAFMSDLSASPNLDGLQEDEIGQEIFRYTWKLLSKRVPEFEEYKNSIKQWITHQDLKGIYSGLIQEVVID